MNTFEYNQIITRKWLKEGCKCNRQLTIQDKPRRTHDILVNGRIDGHAYVPNPKKGFHIIGGCKKQELLELGVKIHDTFNRMYNWYFVVTCDELQKIIARIDYGDE